MTARRSIALCTAASLALATLTPAPAQALDENAARNLLFGAVALGFLSAALQHRENERERESEPEVRYYQPAPAPYVHRQPTYPSYNSPVEDHGWNRGRGDDRGHGRGPVLSAPTVSSKAIPSACVRRLDTQRGPRSLVGKPCLSQHNVNIADLPSSCRRDLNIGGRNIDAWHAGCLQNEGFRIR